MKRCLMVIARKYNDMSATPAFLWKKTFEENNFVVDIFYYRKNNVIFKEKLLRKAALKILNKALIKKAGTGNYDLILVMKGGNIFTSTLEEIKKKNEVIIINILWDNPLMAISPEKLKPYHKVYLKELYGLETLQKAGFNNLSYLPECCSTKFYKKMDLTTEELERYSCDISLLGFHYAYREEFLKHFIDREESIKLFIWGNGWQRLPRDSHIKRYCKMKIVEGIDKIKAINGSKVSLNLHHPLYDIYSINQRTFELGACGAFQLVDYKRDLKTLFDIDREIICFHTPEEAKILFKYYMAHESEATEIGNLARKRILSEHTYQHRFNTLMEDLARDFGFN